MAFESANKMEKSVLAILLLCLPGLLSASCSNPQPLPYFSDPQFFNSDAAFTSGLQESFDPPNSNQDVDTKGDECKNGWCGEDGSCICNPCWSGPTCQEYVDRFAPRFLAEEPFFIVDASTSSNGGYSYSTFLDPAFDPIYPQFASSSVATDFVDPAPSPSPPPTNSWTTQQAASTVSQSTFSQTHFQHHQTPLPLFRIESADDDLGLTCQLGQIGPAATCPCATPRYKVVSASTTFPDKLDALLFSNNGELPESSTVAASLLGQGRDSLAKGHAGHNNDREETSQKEGHNLFWADEETGDVFLQKGLQLQPSQHYFITLQVSALPVNHSGYKPWKDEVVATLYIRPPALPANNTSSFEETFDPFKISKSHDFKPEKGKAEGGKHSAHDKYYFMKGIFSNKMSDGEENVDGSEEVAMQDSSSSLRSSEVYFDSGSHSKEGNRGVRNKARKQTPGVFETDKSEQPVYPEQRVATRNLKTKLPYALRGDRPHYNFGEIVKKHHEEQPAGGDDEDTIPTDEVTKGKKDNEESKISEFVSHRHSSFFMDTNKRRKRQTKTYSLANDVEMTLLKVNPSIPNNPMEDKTKMQLIIALPSPPNAVDFDLEITAVGSESVRFAMLTAYVSSVDPELTFDPGRTNAVPIMKSSRGDSSVFDSALWHWRGVKGVKNEQSRNKEITIDFDIVPVVGGSYSNVSRRTPLLQLSSLLTSSSLSSKEGDGSQKGSTLPTNVISLGKMTKDFNTYLLLIRTRLTSLFPSYEIAHHPSDQSSYDGEKIFQRLFTLNAVNSSASEPSINEPPASGHPSRRGEDDRNLKQSTTLAPSIHNGAQLINKHPSEEEEEEGRGGGVRVKVEGPTEIPQGEWKSYTLKVYLEHPSQFKLTIEQIEGNEIADQDSISVGDIRFTKIGESIARCTKLPEKGDGFRVTCKKLSGGRKGDLCSVESPPLNLCPLTTTMGQFSKDVESRSNFSDQSHTPKQEDESDENAVEFKGIIYGLPSTTPGSKFILRVHVEARSFVPQVYPIPSSSLHHNQMVYEDETRLSGEIVKRQIDEAKVKGVKASISKEKNDFHSDGKNRISIMPSESETTRRGTSGHKLFDRKMRRYRSRRNIIAVTTTTASVAKKPEAPSQNSKIKSARVLKSDRLRRRRAVKA